MKKTNVLIYVINKKHEQILLRRELAHEFNTCKKLGYQTEMEAIQRRISNMDSIVFILEAIAEEIKKSEKVIGFYVKENAIQFLKEVVADGWVQAEVADRWHNTLDHKIKADVTLTTAELYDKYFEEKESTE